MAVPRAAAGVVYTPRDVCEPMVRLALAPLLARDDLRSLRICDPAIGEGAFLIEIVRVLGEALTARGVSKTKARKLVGVRGAGTAFDGLYFVKSVTHTIKRGEYKQSFSLVRNGLVSITPRVPV